MRQMLGAAAMAVSRNYRVGPYCAAPRICAGIQACFAENVNRKESGLRGGAECSKAALGGLLKTFSYLYLFTWVLLALKSANPTLQMAAKQP